MHRREVINMMYLWGVKADTRKNNGKENVAPKTSILKAFLLPLCLQDTGICLDTPVVPSSAKADPMCSCPYVTPDP